MFADPHAPVRTPLSGAEVTWRREDGELFTVSGTWDGSTFKQRFASGTGRRINRYRLGPDGGKLTIDVTIFGGGLPGTMTYQLVYERAASAASDCAACDECPAGRNLGNTLMRRRADAGASAT